MSASTPHPGDDGESTLLDGTRLPKDHALFEALGAVDELGAALGVARAALTERGGVRDADAIRSAQRVLVKIGAELAAPSVSAIHGRIDRTSDADLAWLDTLEEDLRRSSPAPRGFVIPGASPPEAAIHVARAACRTAERRVVACARAGSTHLEAARRYLNRLSGCLYWLALRYGSDT